MGQLAEPTRFGAEHQLEEEVARCHSQSGFGSHSLSLALFCQVSFTLSKFSLAAVRAINVAISAVQQATVNETLTKPTTAARRRTSLFGGLAFVALVAKNKTITT